MEEKLKNVSDEKRKEVIEDAFNEIIENDPIYSGALKIIKNYYLESTEDKIKKITEKNTKLLEELNVAKMNYEKLVEEVKNVKQYYDNDLIKLTKELCCLNKENTILRQSLFQLEEQLNNERIHEVILDSYFNASKVPRKPVIRSNWMGMVEIGKNKVKVPRLDLSMIENDPIEFEGNGLVNFDC